MKFKLDHIGIVVKDIKKSYNYYVKTFGFKKITKIIYEPAHKVKVQFINFGAGQMPVLELVMPIGKKSKVYNFLKNKGEGFHHYAYEVSNIYKSINFLKKRKCFLISNIVPGAGHNKTNTAWLISEKKDLIELVEKQKNKSGLDRFTK